MLLPADLSVQQVHETRVPRTRTLPLVRRILSDVSPVDRTAEEMREMGLGEVNMQDSDAPAVKECRTKRGNGSTIRRGMAL
jgi:hypothetical protein